MGLTHAGFDVIASMDSWEAAIKTFGSNFQHRAQQVEIEWDTPLPLSDVIVGGPPCQGFSSAGRKTPNDERNTLVAVFAHLVSRNRPKAFIFENVEGFLTGDKGRWVVDLLAPLVRAGYCISVRKVNAANYGVPQHRKRVIVVGGLGWLPGLPEPTHRAFGAPGSANIANDRPPALTVEQALAGLPLAVAQGLTPEVSDHVFRTPSPEDAERISMLEPGQTMRDLPKNLWHGTYLRRANRRVSDGTPTERRGGAPAGMRRLRADEPSKAITSGASSEFVHPYEDRMLTLRECARLQTFGDEFEFSGTLAQRALQIGNAVPPKLAEAIGRYLLANFGAATNPRLEPGVYEFSPTFSSAMSPALARTVDLVRETVPLLTNPMDDAQPVLFGG